MLKLSLAAGALGIASPLLPGCSAPLDKSEYPYPLETLSDLEYSVLSKAAAVVLPPRNSGLPYYADLPVLRNVDHQLAVLPSNLRKQIGDALVLFEYGAILLGWHFRPFTRLGADQAHAYLVKWRAGRPIQKAVYGALTRILFSSYWREEATWAPVGYKGPFYRRVSVDPLGSAPLPEEGT